MYKKICYVCSSGGHFDEMVHIRQKLTDIDSFVITEKTEADPVYIKDTYYVNSMSRKDLFWVFKMMAMIIYGVSLLKKEKPNMVISFGAMVTFPFCVAAKVLGIKVVYVESIARVYSLSLTGRLVYPFADLFIVQWENLRKDYPKAVYGGWIYE